jgi:hypothetical protein
MVLPQSSLKKRRISMVPDNHAGRLDSGDVGGPDPIGRRSSVAMRPERIPA